MVTGSFQGKPVRGMILAFSAASSADLAGIPATVIDVWPRLPSGDYLVELEYGEPVRLGPHVITHIGALVSELYVPCRADHGNAAHCIALTGKSRCAHAVVE